MNKLVRACVALCVACVVGLTGGAIYNPLAVASEADAQGFSLHSGEGSDAGGTHVAIQAPRNVRFTRIDTGSDHSLALGSDGNTYAWGDNECGQLGDGTTTNRSTPVRVKTPEGVTFTNIDGGLSFSVALGSDGNTYAWGDNQYDQLGDETTTNHLTPIRVHTPAGVTFTSINAGWYHTLALGSDGNTYAWGLNAYGQLGDETTTNRSTPLRVHAPAGIKFTSIKDGLGQSLALGSDGNTYAWGRNQYGQLGDGTTTNRSTPVRVKTPEGVRFTSIDGGLGHSVALGNDGNTYAWGFNYRGQLGDDTTTNQLTPVRVHTPAGVTFTNIHAGMGHTLALGNDGTLYAWGWNGYGQLGDGTTTNRYTPVRVNTPKGVTFTSIDGGYRHSLALGSDGNTYAWGSNEYGPLGDETTTDRYTPVRVSTPATKVVKVLFDGVEGSNLMFDQASGQWQITTPAHTPGTANVKVQWTVSDVAQPDALLSYTYIGVKHHVSFDAQSGSQVDAQDVEQGKTVNKPADPTRKGYRFVQWTSDKAGKNAFDFKTPVTADITLYAQWVSVAAFGSVNPTTNPGISRTPSAPAAGSSAVKPSGDTGRKSGNALASTGSTISAVATAMLLFSGIGAALVWRRCHA
ncbi:InlB B-repeat-containing protein [Bifidobacterium aquikefiricola]|uniref:InlB B-repeat-containing protein n=1 Tax=Bifidobacterium aquikefiricola TaxID=3059038 RepID=A0AB39U6D4_9BIFI